MNKDTTPMLTASEAKLHFGEMLNQCVYGKRPVFIKKHDKPVAVLISMDDWKQQSSESMNPKSVLYKEFEKFWENEKLFSNKKSKGKMTSQKILRSLRKERLASL